MLPDRSLLIGQKLVENAKIEKCKCDILDDDAFVNFSFDFVSLVLLFRTEFVWREMSYAL